MLQLEVSLRLNNAVVNTWLGLDTKATWLWLEKDLKIPSLGGTVTARNVADVLLKKHPVYCLQLHSCWQLFILSMFTHIVVYIYICQHPFSENMFQHTCPEQSSTFGTSTACHVTTKNQSQLVDTFLHRTV